MRKYNVVISYLMQVEAPNESVAENMALKLYGHIDPTNTDDMTCTVEECDEAMYWSDLVNLTHATQVEKFNFCTCEDNDGNENPYDDCPTGATV